MTAFLARGDVSLVLPDADYSLTLQDRTALFYCTKSLMVYNWMWQVSCGSHTLVVSRWWKCGNPDGPVKPEQFRKLLFRCLSVSYDRKLNKYRHRARPRLNDLLYS